MSPLRYVVLITALVQLFSPAVIKFNEQGIGTDALITPANYAFVIWGPITIASLLYSIFQLLPKQRQNTLYDRMAMPLSMTFAGFTTWLHAAKNEWLWVTIGIFMIMWMGLIWAYYELKKEKKKSSLIVYMLVHGTLGLYIGWSTVAIIVNLGAALRFYGYIYPGEESLVAYLVLLAAATINALAVQRFLKVNWFYTFTIVWAYAAVAINSSFKGSSIIPLLSIVASALVFGYALIQKR
jgi:hypothetical protein